MLVFGACDQLDDDRATQESIRDLEARSCIDLEHARVTLAIEDYASALEALRSIQSRGPQTIHVDRSVDLLRRIAEGNQESELVPRVEHQLGLAAGLLCV